MPDLQAKAHIWGVSGWITSINGLAIGNGTYGGALISSMGARKSFEFVPGMDQTGELTYGTVLQKRKEIDIQFVPVGTVAGNSTAIVKSLLNLLPDSVSYITIADCADSDYNGDYNILEPIGEAYSSNDRASIVLRCVRYDSVTPATLATVIS